MAAPFDPHPRFVAILNVWADDVIAGRIYPTPAMVLALRKAVAAVARRALAANLSYDENGFSSSTRP